MAAQPRPSQMSGGSAGAPGDTTYTKIFVGGLAWETRRDTMRRYFEQFGDILEAVVITDKNTGRSKGYGFVTFKEPEAATRACQDPAPVIDGRRANCNLACLGAARRPRPPSPPQAMGRFRPVAMASTAAYRGSSAYYQQPAQYPYHYSLYGYYGGGYSQEGMQSQMSYYGGQHQPQHFSPFYPAAGPGIYQSFYPYYAANYSQASQAAHSGLGLHYPQMLQYPYALQQYTIGATPIASVPVVPALGSGYVQQPGAGLEQRPSA